MRTDCKRSAIRDARGFTLVELIVVLLILGILATIALPAFLGQRTKGYDSAARAMVRTAMLSLQTFQIDNDTFAATPADLEGIEPSIANASADFEVNGTVDTFAISETSRSGTEFTLTRDAFGKLTRDCSVPGYGLCRAKVDAAGNRW